jgi:catechol 2,3-dioxygenase-like lactoylglutathione lyase family enzyme
MSAWTIDGPRHAGITVSDLGRSIEFYCGLLGLELLWRRLYEEPEITRIVGVPEASGLEIAMLRVPGGDVEVELIEYRGCDSPSGSSPPSHHGTGHFCVFVSGIDALYDELRAQGVSFRSDGPVEMTAGANAGGKSLYALDPDGYVFELHQRPPEQSTT